MADNPDTPKKKKKPARHPFIQFIRRVFDPTGSLEQAGNAFDRAAKKIEKDTETVRRRRR